MMRLPKFTYRVPKTVSEAARMIADAGPEASFVAGGTDLYPNMKRRQQTPRTVISVTRLRELGQIQGDAMSGMVIGSSVSLTEICQHPAMWIDIRMVINNLHAAAAKHGHHRR